MKNATFAIAFNHNLLDGIYHAGLEDNIGVGKETLDDMETEPNSYPERLYRALAIATYWNNRKNPFTGVSPVDLHEPFNIRVGWRFEGEHTWVSENELGIGEQRWDVYYPKYTECPDDRAFMRKEDLKYVFELEAEGRLDEVEPNFKTEAPELYEEIISIRFIAARIITNAIEKVCPDAALSDKRKNALMALVGKLLSEASCLNHVIEDEAKEKLTKIVSHHIGKFFKETSRICNIFRSHNVTLTMHTTEMKKDRSFYTAFQAGIQEWQQQFISL